MIQELRERSKEESSYLSLTKTLHKKTSSDIELYNKEQIKSIYSNVTDEKVVHGQEISILDKDYKHTPEMSHKELKFDETKVADNAYQLPQDTIENSSKPQDKPMDIKELKQELVLSADSYSDIDEAQEEPQKFGN